MESRSVLLTSTTTDVIAVIQPVYVSLTRCQHAQMFLSLFHTNPYRYQYRESDSTWVISEFLLSMGKGVQHTCL